LANEIKIKLTVDGKEAFVTIDKTNEGVNDLIKAIRGYNDAAKTSNEKVAELFNAIRHVVQGVREGYAAVSALFRRPLELAVNREQAETSFGVLLKSTDKAKERINELSNFAATTPFELPNIINASRTLETLTKGALSTGDGLRLVGDAAAGAGVDINDLAMWFGRLYDGIQSGRPVGEALMRMQELGIISGEARGQLEDLGKAGKLQSEGWNVVTTELSKFNGMMEKQADTVGGKISNMNDTISVFLTNIGGSVATVITPVVSHITNLLNTLNGVSPVVSSIVGVVSMLTATFVVLNVTGVSAAISTFLKLPMVFNATKFSAIALSSSLSLTNLSFRSAAVAAKAFITSLGPIGWIVIGVTAAVEAFYLLNDAISGTKSSTTELEKDLKVQQTELKVLTGIVGDNTKSMSERNNALLNIQQKYPNYLDNINLEKIKYNDLQTALKGANDEFERKVRLDIYNEKSAGVLKEIVDLELEKTDVYEKLRNIARNKGGDLSLHDFESGDFGNYSNIRDNLTKDINRKYSNLDKIRKLVDGITNISLPVNNNVTSPNNNINKKENEQEIAVANLHKLHIENIKDETKRNIELINLERDNEIQALDNLDINESTKANLIVEYNVKANNKIAEIDTEANAKKIKLASDLHKLHIENIKDETIRNR